MPLSPAFEKALVARFEINSSLAHDLAEIYVTNPGGVPSDWRQAFDEISAQIRNGNGLASQGNPPLMPLTLALDAKLSIVTLQLVDAFRRSGHFAAKINPLSAAQETRPVIPELSLAHYGVGQNELPRLVDSHKFATTPEISIADLYLTLQRTYCGSVGFEYMHLFDPTEREFLQRRIENGSVLSKPALRPAEQIFVAEKLIQATTFEEELQAHFKMGKGGVNKRFSIEGGETLLPMLSTLLEHSADSDTDKVVLGMAHRGRLNVCANILGKPLQDILAEFVDQTSFSLTGGGDVKYHLGYESSYVTQSGKPIELCCLPNPSHLESINPVVQGRTRNEGGLPVVIHGDQAFSGQGMVPECLNLAQLDGYRTGGTVHIVVNNQIGFRTDPIDGRSTPYCTDLAKGFDIPIFHVNCADVEAACQTVKLALDYRNTFGKDVIIDLYSYRKYGHNEGDLPHATQPRLYHEIDRREPISKTYTESLVGSGVMTQAQIDGITTEYKSRFTQARLAVRAGYINTLARDEHSAAVDSPLVTAVPPEVLEKVVEPLRRVPDGFSPHPVIAKLDQRRLETFDAGQEIDLAFAEYLAFGSLITNGTNVRLTGQESESGTFFQRHAVVVDVLTGRKYVPLAALTGGFFEVCNSPLSEAACLGYEYGFSTGKNRALVIWEAQYGDFANGAQVIIDEYVAAGKSKWNQDSNLVLLLPHGFQGQGPDHSSARLERFLQLCAQENISVCYPTTAAQYFHLLRKQALSEERKPLVVMLPKNLLRDPQASSDLDRFTGGSFQPILEDNFGHGPTERVIVTSGKFYYDLKKSLEELEPGSLDGTTKVIRLEQLYPLAEGDLKLVLSTLGANTKLYYLQEEPENMGAWAFIRDQFRKRFGVNFEYIGPAARPAPEGGSYSFHATERAELISRAIGG